MIRGMDGFHSLVGRLLVAMPGIGGATELGDGRVSLILDVAALIRFARRDVHSGAGPAGQVAAPQPV